MREAVRLDGVEALEVEHRLDEAGAGRVAVGDGEEVGAEGVADGGIGRERLAEGLADEVGRERRVAEPRRDAVGHRGFEGVVVEDHRQDEARQRRLLADRRLGLLTQLRPDGIDDAGNFGRLRPCDDLGHARLLEPARRF